MAKEHIQVFTTTEKREDAERIAETLVGKRLAGCVQILGTLSSTYWWKGEVHKTEEWLCLIKSEKGLYEKLEKTIKKIHPYETPEITALPVISANKEYLAWLDLELERP